MSRFIFFLFFPLFVFCQVQFNPNTGSNTYNITNDNDGETIRLNGSNELVTWSVSPAVDTTALKLRGFVSNGHLVYMQGLNSSTNPNSGGGWFIQADSANPEGGNFGHSYACATAGKQFIRLPYYQAKVGYIEWLGADGTDANSDSVAFQNAPKGGYTKMFLTGGMTYKIPKGIVYTTDTLICFEGIGDDPPIIEIGSNDVVGFHVNPTSLDTTTLADSLWPNLDNEGKVSVTSGTNFSKGDMVFVQSATNWYLGSVKKSELHLVLKVSGNTLWFQDKVWDSYEAITEVVNLIRFKPIKVILRNIHFKYLTPQSNILVYIRKTLNSVIEDCIFEDGQDATLEVLDSYNVRIVNNRFSGATTTTLGYGTWIGGCNFVTLEGNRYSECMRAIDNSGLGSVNRRAVYINNVMDGTGYVTGGATTLYDAGSKGINAHEGSEFVLISGNQISNYNVAMTSDGYEYTLSHNKLSGRINFGVVIGNGGNISVVNNEYTPAIASRDSLGDDKLSQTNVLNAFVKFDMATDPAPDLFFNISNNMVNGLTGAFITSAAIDTIWNLVLVNNINIQAENKNASIFSGGFPKLVTPTILNNIVRTSGTGAEVFQATIHNRTQIVDNIAKAHYWNSRQYYTMQDTVQVDALTFKGASANLLKIELYPATADSMRFIITNKTVAAKDTSDWIGLF